jgi:hypothetical protein
MSLTKLSLGGNNLYMTSLFPPRESLVSDIPAGDGNIEKLSLLCRKKCHLIFPNRKKCPKLRLLDGVVHDRPAPVSHKGTAVVDEERGLQPQALQVGLAPGDDLLNHCRHPEPENSNYPQSISSLGNSSISLTHYFKVIINFNMVIFGISFFLLYVLY